jgi:hypothetical protein
MIRERRFGCPSVVYDEQDSALANRSVDGLGACSHVVEAGELIGGEAQGGTPCAQQGEGIGVAS